MKITDIKIDGFGVWHDLAIRGLSPELTVFYGPNEAGKSTLMQFIRSVLYGVSPTTPHVFATSAAVLAVSALAATLLPARRAAAIDPMVVLKE